MPVSVITHRLELVLRLTDTTTGRPVAATDVSLFKDNAILHPMEKERGTLIFSGLGKESFILELRSRLYEPIKIPIVFPLPDPKLPLLEIHLIPSKDSISPVPCLSLEGLLPEISELNAIRLNDSSCLMREFDPRKKLALIFNPHKLELSRTHYALLDPEALRYERFSIVKKIDNNSIKLDRNLETEIKSNLPICPVVFGHTEKDGSYHLRVRDDSTNADWLISYKIGDEAFFEKLDLRQTAEIPLRNEKAYDAKYEE
ncbi:MAG: hypothetical protein GX025_01640 [Clostridiales bacterium]|jgi:hypothetical protein|nr:hypothetical protein [Clostridiales bacterium]